MAGQPRVLAMMPETGRATTVPTKLPEKAMDAILERSWGGAHCAQTAWMQGYVTPYKYSNFNLLYRIDVRSKINYNLSESVNNINKLSKKYILVIKM